MPDKITIGIIGAGSMGSGIAQVAANAGHPVMLFDAQASAVEKALALLDQTHVKLIEKQKITAEDARSIRARITQANALTELNSCGLVLEAIVEKAEIKKELFKQLESIVSKHCILATNTSSLSIASIGSACEHPERVIGIHFFNPAPLMPLVEIIPSVQTNEQVFVDASDLIRSWKKVVVKAKDTPGFIVNKVARPFYGEALRIYEEGVADFATIDWAMKNLGGFKMGPFELMDYIGNDINYTVTETVFREFYYDPRYKPSFTQKRMFEAGRLGRKTGRGYYDYAPGAVPPAPHENYDISQVICSRILSMLINEAADTLFMGIATRDDIDLAMTKGVNYPKGLLAWADEIGIERVLETLEFLQSEYGEDRYRPCPLLKQMVRDDSGFYSSEDLS